MAASHVRSDRPSLRDRIARLRSLATGDPTAAVRALPAELDALEQMLAADSPARDADATTTTALHEAFFEKTDLVKLLIDPDSGAIYDANPAACRFYGYTRAAMRSLHISAINRLPRNEVSNLLRMASTEQRSHFLFEHVLASGAKRCVDVHSSPVQIDGRRLLFSIVHDVTERRDAQEALRAQRDFAEGLINTAQAIVLVLDRNGDVVRLNQYAEELTGLRQSELRGTSWIDAVIPAERRASVRALFQETLTGQFRGGNMDRLSTPDGRELWIEWYGRPLLDAHGRATGLLCIGHDMTERVRAEAALRESESELRGIIDSVSDCIVLINGDGVVQTCNALAKRVSREIYSRELARGDSIFEYVAPAETERLRGDIASAMAGTSRKREAYLDKLDEWWEMRYQPVRAADGQIWAVCITGLPVTERKRSMDLLRIQRDFGVALSSTDDLQEVAELLLDATLRIEPFDCGSVYRLDDATGDLVLITDWGISDRFRASSMHVAADRPEARAVAAGVPRYGAFTPDSPFSIPERQQDGIRGHAVVPVLYQGRVLAAIALGTRKQTEIGLAAQHALEAIAAELGSVIARVDAAKALRESEARYRLLAENTTDIISRFDAGLICQYASPACESLLGYRPAHFVGRHLSEICHPDDLSRLRRKFDRLQQEAGTARQEHRLQAQSGEWVWVETSARPLEPERTPGTREIIAVTRDITQRRSIEQRMRQHQSQLAHAGRLSLMGEMASGLAHEINQPLCSMSAAADGCLRRLAGDGVVAADLAEPLRLIASESRRAGEIVRRMRQFGRQQHSPPGAADLNDILREALALVEHEADLVGVSIRLALRHDLPPVRADRIEIQQVLINLVRNAIEAVAALPQARRVIEIISERQDRQRVRVRVTDHGPGLPDGAHDRVFAPFFTTKTDGMGLGLAISQTIIERHGGRLYVASGPAEGSAFCFDLLVAGSGDDRPD